jgi:oligopeptide/dipeptide ABC transporter ATP-binding protein
MEHSTLLSAADIRKHFPLKAGFFGRAPVLKAVDGISFGVKGNTVFALVGESGCGKSTVARLILRLLPLTSGTITFKGQDLSRLQGHGLKAFRRAAQIIFQDPFASLNPRMRVLDTLSEPFKIHKLAPRGEIRSRVVDLLRKVGLDEEVLNKYPHEFSGGQRQRICIARALSVSPELIVADEPLSALDVSIQAQILNLFQDIRRETAISLIFISHDLNVVRYLSDDVAVMYLGRIVEKGPTDDIFRSPRHPYTKLLLVSVPTIRHRGESSEGLREPRAARHAAGGERRGGPSADVPSPVEIPAGCPFHPRCPERIGICDSAIPELRNRGASQVSCHLYD